MTLTLTDSPSLTSKKRPAPAGIAEALLFHYDKTARRLPWRVSPEDYKQGVRPDPYRVWLSEIMLQQTGVLTVKEYYLKFLNLFPTVFDMAKAEEEEILQAWAGLGYYARARNLYKCARIVAERHGGRFPETEEALLTLPGVGDYTAAAITAIAFNAPAAPVDGNIERVFSRLFLIDTPLPKAKKTIKSAVAAHLPPDRPGDFAQALMDLGSDICTPKKPACLLCPIRGFCEAQKTGTQEAYPVKPVKKAKPHYQGVMLLLTDKDDRLYIRKRGDKGVFAGMYEFPFAYGEAAQSPVEIGEFDFNAESDIEDFLTAPILPQEKNIGAISHVFTHFSLKLDVALYKAKDFTPEAGKFFDIKGKEPLPSLPTLMRKALSLFAHRR